MSKIKTRFRTIDGLSIRYAESDGPREVEALLTSPWPESLYAFDAVWDHLAEHAHLVAVDLPGFGHSEMRQDLLTPQAMGEFYVRIADAFGLTKPHVVAPDVGTSASLFAAARHPERFSSVTVGSGGAAVPINVEGVLNDWVHATDLAPYRALGPKDVVTVAMEAIEGYELPDEVRQDYLAAYQGERFADQIPYVQAYHQDLPVLGELLPGIQTPVGIIAGRKDEVVPLANAEFLDERLPNSKLYVVDVGHFVWEEDAAEYARAVLDLWKVG